jgi:succinyl-diaminopimelate desuccinylase
MEIDLTGGSVALTQTLCDIESQSGQEREIADAIESALSSMPHLTLTRDGDTIVARTDTGRSTRVLVAGHLDTVPVHDNLPTRRERIDGADFLRGRGTVDMKAGVAVQLVLAAALTQPAMDVTWVWYDNEEVDARRNGLGRVIRHRPDLLAADFAVLGEPTAGRVEAGCNGTIRAEVTTTGVRAHSARAWLGENAIHKAAPILDLLAGYSPRTARIDGLDYREGLNAVRIGGGVAGNVIPDRCTVEVNYRFAPDRSLEEARDHLRDLFGQWRLDVVDAAAGARPGLEAPAARDFVSVVGAEVRAKQGWTDVARFSALGVPAVNYGPGDPGMAHADDERVPVEQIERCEASLRRWLGGARAA